MKYRIIENDLGCFPQVKRFLFWKNVGEGVYGRGLYSKANFDYPMSFDECRSIIKKYIEWNEMTGTAQFVYYWNFVVK